MFGRPASGDAAAADLGGALEQLAKNGDQVEAVGLGFSESHVLAVVRHPGDHWYAYDGQEPALLGVGGAGVVAEFARRHSRRGKWLTPCFAITSRGTGVGGGLGAGMVGA